MLNHKGTVTLKSQRLILRKFSNMDAKSVYKNWAGDEPTVKDIDFSCHKTLDETEDFIMDSVLNYDNYNYNFAIVLKETDEVIGAIQLINIDNYLKKCYVGFVLGQKFQNRGYATEALKTILDFALNTVGFVKVIGLCRTNNQTSERVMKKCNMEFEGIARKEIRVGNKFYDAKIYAILNNAISV